MGADVVLVARRVDRLQALAAEIEQRHRVKATVLALDLGKASSAAELFAATETAGRSVDILINNAGFGTHDDFLSIAWEKIAEQLQLNIVTLTELAHRFGAAMRARKRGYILNVSSVAAFQPVPYYATYAASKAYVRDFSEALAAELKGAGVQVTCVSPGGTRTEFQAVAGQRSSAIINFTMMSAERCVRLSLHAMFRKRRHVVTGLANVIAAWLTRFVPRRWLPGLAVLVTGRPKQTLPEKLAP